MHFLRSVLLTALALSTVVSAASAEYEAFKGWKVGAFEIVGVEGSMRKELERGLILPGTSKLLRRQRPRFYPNLLQDDIRRSQLFLARKGYPSATIDSQVVPAGGEREVRIELRIDPGVAVRVAAIEFVGLDSTEVARLRPVIALQPGRIFTDRDAAEAVDRCVEFLNDSGYASATASKMVTRLDDQTVRVQISVDRGPLFRFGEVIVQGADPSLVPLIRRVARVREGDVYSPAVLREAQMNLRFLDLFRKTRLSPQERDGDVLDVRTEVVDLPRRHLDFGVGYLTDDQFWARARWKHRNLFAAGRGMDVQSSVSRYTWRVAVSTWYPALWHPRTRGSLTLSTSNQKEEAYDELTHRIAATLRTRMSAKSSWFFGVEFSDVQLDLKTEDVDAFRERGGLLTVFTLGANHDSSDDPLFPTRGGVSAIRALLAPIPQLSRAEFASLRLTQSRYLSLFGDVVSASRITGALATPLGDSSDLLPQFRFTAGGASSMRGFRRRQLGPTDRDGSPIGGQALLEAATELRFPIVGRAFGAAFVDVGQVWSDAGAATLQSLEVAVGPALMIRTPVGPIRGDVGYRLTTRDTSESRVAFHLSIGQPF